ncbi:hypothetical protein AF335_08955 [Streptomyces eurocidicus]|uniref:Uncharacterized protein n=1 Tax=Streptomyces eurocidicus TaxID=66423 RepID=A0A2N8P0W1_STREU|nr:hypothetical protein [Streptomyces eurocidicus]MBB5121767.1 hypothetical protein [Streptomyces eurocidicus]MBF6055035.1 hypothetical protein [Streptomyces eurocidicus]PNE34651.1 hypothetical protein AF335_08955 [Streptomyces eurocidicus]
MGKAMHAGRAKRWSKLAAVPVGVLASGAMVLGATHATVTASTWNEGNTIASGKWSKAEVNSNKADQAFINVSALEPGQSGSAVVEYTFASDIGGVEGQEGMLMLKDMTAKDAGGNPVGNVKDSDLAQYLKLQFTIKNLSTGKVDDTGINSVARLAQEGEGEDASVQLWRKLLDEDKTKNKYEVTVQWTLDANAPVKAQKSTVGFSLGATVDDLKG